MQDADYPALYLSADQASNEHQKQFLGLIKGEYTVLISAAVFSLCFLTHVTFAGIYAMLFFGGLAILLVRAFWKPEQSWYRSRALAESVKTLTWRYAMRATPFQGAEADAKKAFRVQLHKIFDDNKITVEKIPSDWATHEQITPGMDAIRAKNLRDRLTYYLANRVDEQRGWYSDKATANRDNALFWVKVSAAAYIIAGGIAIAKIAYPTWPYFSAEPLIVIAASIVGWMQIRKFGELAAAYTVAAHEIGLIKPKASDDASEDEFSEFVNDAEKAFSREHTLWIARQSD